MIIKNNRSTLLNPSLFHCYCFKELKNHFDEQAIIELTALIAFQNMSSKFNSALDIEFTKNEYPDNPATLSSRYGNYSHPKLVLKNEGGSHFTLTFFTRQSIERNHYF